MPAGAPSKYDPKYCEMLIEHMGEGYSFDSFAGGIGVSIKTLYNWKDLHDKFLHAQREGQSKSLKKFEEIAMGQMSGKIQGSAAVLIFWMKNRFNWTDKKEIEQTNTNFHAELVLDEDKTSDSST